MIFNLLAFNCYCFAQSIQKKYDTPYWEWSSYISATSTGNIIGCGLTAPTSSPTRMDVNLFKLNSKGDLIWSKSYTGDSANYSNIVLESNDGSYVLTGGTSTLTAGNYDIFLMKTDSSGEPIWNKSFGTIYNDGPSSLIKTKENGFLISGSFRPSGIAKTIIIKCNSDGDTLWTKVLGSPFNCEIHSSLEANNGYYLAGYTLKNNYLSSGLLVKTDFNGDTIWTKDYSVNLIQTADSNRTTIFTSIDLIENGGLIISGMTGQTLGTTDIFILKVDSLGNPLNYKIFSEPDSERPSKIFQTSDGGFLIVGNKNYADSPDAFLLKINSSLEYTWSKVFSSFGSQQAYSSVEMNDGTFLTAIENWPIDGLESYYFIKADSVFSNNNCEGRIGIFKDSIPQLTISSSNITASPSNIIFKDITAQTSSYPYSLTETIVCEDAGLKQSNVVSLAVYPNPTYGQINFVGITDFPVNLEVYNYSGEKIFSIVLSSDSFTLPSQFPDGIYMYQMEIKNRLFTGKFVKAN